MITLPNKDIDIPIFSKTVSDDISGNLDADLKERTVCAMADWMEVNCILLGHEITLSSVVDVLHSEEELFETVEMAELASGIILSELERRVRICQESSPFEVDADGIRPKSDIDSMDGAQLDYLFCSIVSLSEYYGDKWRPIDSNYNERGRIFELVTERRVRVIFPGYNVYKSGWSAQSDGRFQAIVQSVSSICHGSGFNQLQVLTGKEKDASLDVVAAHPFACDRRQSRLVFLFQCSAGLDYENKWNTPKVELWKPLVNIQSHPIQVIAIPRVLTHRQLQSAYYSNCGLVIDRFRLFSNPARITTSGSSICPDTQNWCKTVIQSIESNLV